MRRALLLTLAVIGASNARIAPQANAEGSDYARDVAPILAKYCLGCHGADEPEGELSLENYASLAKGGGRGAVVVPGKAAESLLLQVLSGQSDLEMPPEDNERPTPAEIDLLRAWVDAGAAGPATDDGPVSELAAPSIPVAAHLRPYLTSLAVSPDGAQVALGGFRRIEIIDADSRGVVATSDELVGKVNSLSYSADGQLLVVASGQPGLYGMVTICRAADGQTVKQFKGHKDAIYDARLSPDGRVLATCSYDRDVSLWDAQNGDLLRTLTGHTGAVFETCFSPDGSKLVSASADATVKVWAADTGARLDTLGQAEREQYATAISPDGQFIAAGGGDRKIRVWRLESDGIDNVRPLIAWRAAHKAAIVAIAYSPDGSMLASASEGGELTIWDAATLTPRKQFDRQSDVVTGLAFAPRGDGFFVARLDGSWDRYAAADEQIAQSDDRAAATEDPVAQPLEAPVQDIAENEPNDAVDAANGIAAHAVAAGTIAEAGDVDTYKFAAREGQQFVLEVEAAQQDSSLDSRLEVLDSAGRPMPRVLLQAVRESFFTFRGANSNSLSDFRLQGWEDMELNDFVYANGEVFKLWLYPRGPDSGFLVYPGTGDRRYSYFGATPITHALNEPCYVVVPHPPQAKPPANGLPTFLLYYENDDDGWRNLGADSRLTFTAPADGEYLVRLTDVRGQGGDAYHYKLHVRAPRPDFDVHVEGNDLTVNAGSGKEIAVSVRRIDEFDGEVQLDVTGLPPGFHLATPWTIQAGQTSTYATITADADAPAPTEENCKSARVIASAMINGNRVVKDEVSLGEIKLADAPSLLVRVLPLADALDDPGSGNAQPVTLEIAPGETIAARVKVERGGFDGEISFGLESAGRNLPHGVFVDNIGLNGVVVMTGENERQFFITAAKWVPETTRFFHLRTEAEGNQTSLPVLLRVHSRAQSVASRPGNSAD